jgi:hypothetical protein
LESIPPELDAALRRQAEVQRKPLEEVAVDALRAALVIAEGAVRRG